jgi:hypothetical protein
MTLFWLAMDDPDNPFRQALDRWCGGRPDEQTLALIDAGGSVHRRRSVASRSLGFSGNRGQAVAAASPIAASSDRFIPSEARL